MESKRLSNNIKSRIGIGTLNEKSLHSDLIQWLAKPEDKFEEKIDGYIIDIIRGKKLLEIQTKNIYKIKKKIYTLSKNYTVQIFFPIIVDKWILKVDENDEQLSKRKSPKRGRIEDIFTELIRIPTMVSNQNISLSLIFIQAEEVWKNDGKGSWRRKKWSIVERYLLKVVEVIDFSKAKDFVSLLPNDIQDRFTNKDLSKSLGVTTKLAQKMTYCLRKMGILEVVETRGREYIFSLIS
jgi:hypothetical protein